ncbi:MAG: MATE family efflux transporter, partial [Planctomycetota bacterium]
ESEKPAVNDAGGQSPVPCEPSRRSRLYCAVVDWRGVIERVAVAPDAAEAPGLDEQGRLKTGRLKGLTMSAAIWTLSWPIVTESFLNWLVGMTDTVIAAELGVAVTDAIAIAAYVMWFIGLIAMAIGLGATAMVSRSVGRGRLAVANACVGQALLLAAIGGGTVAALVAVLAGPVGDVMFLVNQDAAQFAELGPDEQSLAIERGQVAAAAFADYMRIIAFATPMASVLFAGIACIRGAGDSIKPLGVMALVNGINALASYALSGADIGGYANPFRETLGLDMGVRGVAIGTAGAHIVGCIAVLVVLARGVGGVRLIGRRLRPHSHTIRRLVRVALPNFIETVGMWVGNFAVVLIVGALGMIGGALGAHLITIRIEAISFLPGFAMSMAAATLAGQYLGAGSRRGATRAVLICTGISTVIMGVFGLLLMLIPRTLTALISDQPEHLELAPPLLFVIGAVQVPFALAITIRGALRGAGDTRVVMIITWVTTYLVRLPLVYALSGVDLPLPNGEVFDNPFRDEVSLTGVWLAMSIELVIRCLIFIWRFWQGGWAETRV